MILHVHVFKIAIFKLLIFDKVNLKNVYSLPTGQTNFLVIPTIKMQEKKNKDQKAEEEL